MFESLKDTLDNVIKSGSLDELSAEVDEAADVELQYGEGEGEATSHIIVRPAGDDDRIIVQFRYTEYGDAWSVLDADETKVGEVSGRDNYDGLAKEIEERL